MQGAWGALDRMLAADDRHVAWQAWRRATAAASAGRATGGRFEQRSGGRLSRRGECAGDMRNGHSAARQEMLLISIPSPTPAHPPPHAHQEPLLRPRRLAWPALPARAPATQARCVCLTFHHAQCAASVRTRPHPSSAPVWRPRLQRLSGVLHPAAYGAGPLLRGSRLSPPPAFGGQPPCLCFERLALAR